MLRSFVHFCSTGPRCLLMLSALCGFGWLHPLTAGEPTPQVMSQPEQGLSQIVIPSRQGLVDWDDVAAALAEVNDLDPDVARNLVPSGTVDLDKTSTALALFALNRVFAPGVKLSVERKRKGNSPQLMLTINHRELQQTRRKLKAKFRDLIGSDEKQQYGLALDPDWKSFPADHPVVILVHGFNSETSRLEPLHRQIRGARCPVAMFEYPNDQEIHVSAEMFSQELESLHETVLNRPLIVLALSMGGLVAREAIENPELDTPQVQRLILVATPNSGSTWAQLAFGVDLWEHLVKHPQWNVLASTRAAIADGLGEAAKDLKPGSPFLTELNSRERNSQTHYTLVLGTDGPLNEGQLLVMKASLQRLAEKQPAVRLVQHRLETALRDFDEVLKGKGDGVVSLERGRLEGVDDLLILPLSHRNLLHEFETPAGKELWEFLLERLEIPEDN